MAADLMISAQLLWGLISILIGFIILAAPKLLAYLVALYLIITGLLSVVPALI